MAYILRYQTKLVDLKIFSTWYPTAHKFPWLMTDHTYHMGVLNENIGYNQPPNLGYYIGSDLISDRQAWDAYNEQNAAYIAAFNRQSEALSITDVEAQPHTADDACYTLSGQRMDTPPAHGIYIYRGRKVTR